jgi:hypothetical protein
LNACPSEEVELRPRNEVSYAWSRTCANAAFSTKNLTYTGPGSNADLHTDKYKALRYLLTPWSRVLLEKLTDSAASQEIPRIFGTRKFLTVLTSVRHIRHSDNKKSSLYVTENGLSLHCKEQIVTVG